MTRTTPESEALIVNVGLKWSRYKAERVGIETRIRRRVEAEHAAAVLSARVEVAQAMQFAIDAGATKTSIRKVTSKNPGTVEEFLALLAPEPDTIEDTNTVAESTGLHIERLGKHLSVTLDPGFVRATEWHRNDPDLWGGLFEVFTRPTDGKVFIDPVELSEGITPPSGVIEWLRADRANEEVVAAWVTANPQTS